MGEKISVQHPPETKQHRISCSPNLSEGLRHRVLLLFDSSNIKWTRMVPINETMHNGIQQCESSQEMMSLMAVEIRSSGSPSRIEW